MEVKGQKDNGKKFPDTPKIQLYITEQIVRVYELHVDKGIDQTTKTTFNHFL